MDNFNIQKFFRDQYLAESNLDDKLRAALGDEDFEKVKNIKVPGLRSDKEIDKKMSSGKEKVKEIIKKTVKEYTSEYDPATAKRNFFAASYNRPGDTERFRNYMEFLSKLRISGKTNMLDAVPSLQAEFNIEKKEAKDLLAYWMGGWRNPDLDESLNEDDKVDEIGMFNDPMSSGEFDHFSPKEPQSNKISKPRYIKDKNNPNFLRVFIDYPTPEGAAIALGKETMSGQTRRLGAAAAMQNMDKVAKDLKSKYNIEDIEITDMENGKIQLFAVSDDFIDKAYISVINPSTLNEMDMNDPVVMRARAARDEQPEPSRGGLDFEDVMYLRDEQKDLEDRIAQLYRDMEQEAEPEGGEIADRYGSMLNKLEDKLYRVKKQINQYDMNESLNEKEGVKHYTKDGKEWTGATHKMPNGKLMTQSPHNEDSEELFHKEDLSESLNPEVLRALDSFIKAMAKRYSYSERDAVFAIKAAMKQRDADGVNEVELTQDFGELEESHTDAENRQLKKISKALDKASKMHKDQSKKIKKIVKEEDVASLKEKLKNIEEGKPGLWDNIRAKRASGKKMSSKGSKAYKSAVKAGNKINREDS